MGKKNKKLKKTFGKKGSNLRQALKKAVADDKVTKKDIKKLVSKGATKSQLKALQKTAKKKDSLKINKKVDTKKELKQIRSNTLKQNFVSNTAKKLNLTSAQKKSLKIALKDKGKPEISKKDIKDLAKAGLSKKDLIKISNKASKSPGVKTGSGVTKDKIKTIKQNANQKLGENLQAEQDKFDDLVKEGGNTRVKEDEILDDQVKFDDDGIGYQVYDTDGGLKTVKIGNLPGHRFEDSSYADIKIIDYDATVEGYDPQKSLKKLGIIKDNVYDSKGKIKGVTLEEPKVKRQDYTADTFRDNKQKEDYSERGLTEEGGQITGYKGELYEKEGEYDKVQTDKYGNLKRLTLTADGNFKPTDDNYSSIVKSNTFSDELKAATGLKSDPITRKARMGSIKSRLAKHSRLSKDTYITAGKTQLSIK